MTAGHETPHVRERAEQFYLSVAEIFERWVVRRLSAHTQRAYREDAMSFVRLWISSGRGRPRIF